MKDLILSSAGLEVDGPVSPPTEAILAARNFSVYHSDHRSKLLTLKMMEEFDVIVAVEVDHFERLQKLYPQFKKKVILLPLYEMDADEALEKRFSCNIDDPYGKPVDQFVYCFKRIEKCLEGVFNSFGK